MIIKQINGMWEIIEEWCNNQQKIFYQIPRKVKTDINGQPIQINQWEYEPADDNDEMIDVYRQGNRCEFCSDCTECYNLTLPAGFNGDINHYNIIFDGHNATLGDKNSYGLFYDYNNELIEIKYWFEANDYKVNKITIGEWENTDPRWIDYLAERTIKRARQDELNALIEALQIESTII